MKKTILYFIIIIFFSIIIHAEAVNKNKTTHYKIRKENGEFIIDYNSKSDTIRNLNEFAKKYSTGSKKSKSDKIKNENKKCFSRDLSNKYLSLKESYQFKLDTTKYAFPMGSSAFNFYKKKLVTTVLDKNTKTSNLNGYSLALSSGNKLEKAILLFDCENRTEPKRFGTTGKSREAFGKTHSLQFNDDKIISFQVGKIGIWNKDAILEKIFEVEHSFTGNRFVIENNSIYGSSSWPLLLDSVKSCIKLDFEKSKYEEGTYDISYSKAFYDISDFEKRYKLDKLFIEDDETSNNINKYFCESVVPGTSTLSKGEDVFFLLNNSGKAILEMDYDLNIINSYPLNELVERRDIELKDITLQDFRKRDRISYLMNLFYNKYKKQFLIHINNSKFMMGKGLPDREIWVYSIEGKKVIKKIPFDTYINGFDPKTNRISRVYNIDDQNFEVQVYEIK